MAGCCDPRGYDEVFGDGFARHVARRYRRRGLDRTARRLVDFLADGDLSGATVLEIGGGVGEIGVELLRRGAARATTLELSPAYDDQARRLAAEAGVADRMHRAVVDIATTPEDVAPADLVVLHRVVCCYPDHERLLGAAADHCRRRLAFTHPPRNPVSRATFAVENAMFRLRGREFRAFVHPPEAMVDVVLGRGMRHALHHAGTIWQVQGLTR
jgi:magnesium-protoporphyrin O-methyltransferase